MQQKAIFSTPTEAIETTFTMLARLSALVVWIGLMSLHLLLCVLLLALAWATQTTAGDVWAAFQTWFQSTPVTVLSAVGVSALSVAAGYLWVLRKLHYLLGAKVLPHYLLKGA